MGDTSEVISKDRVPQTPPAVEARASQPAASLAAPAINSVEAEAHAHPPVGLRDVRNNEKVRAYIAQANEQMLVIGYSEHGLRHAALAAAIARNICLELDYEPRVAELAAIAGYLHDIGN